MKPNFALGLTSDGITLWQRGRSGWLRVGAVNPEAPTRDAQLQDLARIAHALAPEGVTTKLVIPDEQILFCDLEVSSRNRDEQSHEIRAQLHGLTPYPVEELDFDWTINGSKVHVAVVARETLVEAEDFAQGFGLNPVSATAAPENGRFNREPFFGATRLARSIVGDPDLIEREPEILRETGIAELPEPEMVKHADAAKPTAESAQSKADTEVEATPEPEAESESESESEQQPKPTPEPEPAQKPTPDSTAPEKQAAEPAKAAAVNSDVSAPKTKTEPPSDTSAAPKSGGARTGATGVGKAKTGKGFADILKSRAALSDDAVPSAITPPTSGTKDAESVTFSSRRAPGRQSGTPPTPTAKRFQKGSTLGSETGMFGGLRSKLAGSAALTSRSSDVASKLRKSFIALKPKAMGQVKKATSAIAAARPAKTGLTQWSKERFGSKGPAQPTPDNAAAAAATEDTAVAPPARRDPLETLHDRAKTPGSQTEAERLTIFGARQQTTPEPSRMQRGLLVLGGVGLLLIAVAIWVFFFTSTQPPAPTTAALPDESDILAPEAVTPLESAVDSESPLRLDDLIASDEIEAALGLEDAAQQPPLDLAEPDVMAQPEQIMPQQQAQPPASGDINPGRVAGLRSIGLIAPQETVPLPLSPSPPAPFGSEPLPPLREELATVPDPEIEPADSAASDLPSAEELLEITVTEGRPPVVPPARPAGIAPEPEPEPIVEVAPDPAPEASPPVAEVLDESELDIPVSEGRPAAVPPLRPEGLAPEAEVQPDPAPEPETGIEPQPDAAPAPEEVPAAEDGMDPDQAGLTTPPPGGVVLSALRPAARPEQIIQAALTPEPEPVPGAADASSYAVAESLRPSARPSQFSAIVQRALRNAQPRGTAAIAALQTAPAQTAPAATEPVQTARAAAAAPVIPTSASVAREATQSRAINLRQVNLIGVMGTSNNRRALVRLSNGRVVTVRVGESLDGGQVTAIGEDELRYNRRGRDVVLRIAS